MALKFQHAVKTHRFALPWVVVKKLLGKLVRIETMVVFRRELQSGLATFVPADAALQIMRIDDPQHGTFASLAQKYPEKNFPSRLQRAGQQCFVAVRNGVLAGYAWTAAKNIYLDEIACDYSVARGELFFYDCFVEPDCRGCGIYPAMLAFMLADAVRRGEFQVATIAAAAENRASIRGILKAGFSEDRRIRYVAFRQRQKWWGLDPLGQL